MRTLTHIKTFERRNPLGQMREIDLQEDARGQFLHYGSMVVDDLYLQSTIDLEQAVDEFNEYITICIDAYRSKCAKNAK